jgi:hypothetical protein
VGVVTTDLLASKTKFSQRVLDALLGIVLGLLIGQLFPKTEVSYSLAIIAIMLTLISSKSYFIAFSSRCFLLQ